MGSLPIHWRMVLRATLRSLLWPIPQTLRFETLYLYTDGHFTCCPSAVILLNPRPYFVLVAIGSSARSHWSILPTFMFTACYHNHLPNILLVYRPLFDGYCQRFPQADADNEKTFYGNQRISYRLSTSFPKFYASQ